MALTVGIGGGGGGARILCGNTPRTPCTSFLHRPLFTLPLSSRANLHIVSAKKFQPRSRRFDSKKRRGSTTTEEQEQQRFAEDEDVEDDDDDYFLPELPGDKPDFWEGEQWDGLGFFVQYLWAFGLVFAVISAVIAAATYNEGATDFKMTPAYKESIQSQELLEEPEESDSDVFESNPTEVAPSLE